ncbi:MAG: 1-deoxy-D-xylulose-5-phosphate synthase [Candidatus Marinimicrobia bacterium]|nr:1-deoxy-D-xylulose-5-phosphate synthase [Candidatus Neomarinimicrobiota bacterium]
MSTQKFVIGMRDAFFNALYEIAKQDKNVIIITADNGAPTLDQFSQNLPNQFFTVGIAEQQMIGMACGMAVEGKKVYTYAIAPFVTTRVHEFNKLCLGAMNLPIVNLGVGAGYAYDIMGPTHHTVEDITIMRSIPNMKVHSPADSSTAASLAQISYDDPSPQYIRFDRTGIPDLYSNKKVDFKNGLIQVKGGEDLCIIATGIMVHQALEVASELQQEGIKAGVIDLHRIKPITKDLLMKHIQGYLQIVTIEEHLLAGGMGSAIAEIFADEGITTPLLRIGQNDKFVFELGGRQEIWKTHGLDVAGILKQIKEKSILPVTQ